MAVWLLIPASLAATVKVIESAGIQYNEEVIREYQRLLQWPTEIQKARKSVPLSGLDSKINQAVEWTGKILNAHCVAPDLRQLYFGLKQWTPTGEDALLATYSTHPVLIKIKDTPAEHVIIIEASEISENTTDWGAHIASLGKQYLKEGLNMPGHKEITVERLLFLRASRVSFQAPRKVTLASTQDSQPALNLVLWLSHKRLVIWVRKD